MAWHQECLTTESERFMTGGIVMDSILSSRAVEVDGVSEVVNVDGMSISSEIKTRSAVF